MKFFTLLFTTLFLVLLNTTVDAQSFNGGACPTNIAIPDNDLAGIQDTVSVTGAGTSLGNDIILESVTIHATHTWSADLDIYLTSPNGVTVTLTTDNGGSGRQYGDDCNNMTTFNMSASTAITGGLANFVGSYLPEGNFADFNDASSANGDWILLVADDANGDTGHLEFVELVFATCYAPDSLYAASITSSSADLGWIETGSASSWQIEWDTTGFSQGIGNTMIATNTQNISGLNPATSYDFYVRAICGAGDTSNWVGPYNFITLCDVFTPDYTETFDSFAPACWEEADGGDALTGPTSIGAGTWDAGTTIGNTSRINLYNTLKSDWLLSPMFDLSSGGYEVVVDVAVTDWNGSTADVMGSDDSVQVFYSEDGITWNNLMVWTAADALPNSLTTFSVAVPSTGSNVQFGILATDGPIDDLEDYDFHIDNFIVRTPPTCPQPTAVNAIVINGVDATIGWTDNAGTSSWQIEWDTTGFAIGTGNLSITSNNPEVISSLSPVTSYDFYVRAICGAGDTSVWTGPFNFTTPCVAPIISAFPWSENFDNETTPSVPCGWVISNDNSDANEWQTSTALPNSGANSLYLGYNTSVAANDWIFTPELQLVAGTDYTMKFSYRARSAAFPESMSVWLGSARDAASMTTLLFDSTDFTHTAYDTVTVNINPSNTGSYFVGFFGYSSANQWAILVDDVSIDFTTSVLSNNRNSELRSYPNPSKGVFTLSGIEKTANVSIVNTQGKVVYQNANFKNKQLVNLSKNAKGLYFISITSNNKTKTIKVLIQ